MSYPALAAQQHTPVASTLRSVATTPSAPNIVVAGPATTVVALSSSLGQHGMHPIATLDIPHLLHLMNTESISSFIAALVLPTTWLCDPQLWDQLSAHKRDGNGPLIVALEDETKLPCHERLRLLEHDVQGPFPLDIAAPSIGMLLRRQHDLLEQANTVHLPSVTMHLKRREVFVGYPVQQQLHLQPFEWAILVTMARGAGWAATTEEFINVLYGPDFIGDYRSINVRITSLRRKLRPIAGAPSIEVRKGGSHHQTTYYLEFPPSCYAPRC